MKRRYRLVALFIIVLVGFIARVVLAYELPIMGDGANHAVIIEKIAQTGILPLFSNYPTFFHLLNAIIYNCIGAGYKFMPAIMGSLTIVVFYLFTKELMQSSLVGILGALIVAVYPYHILLSALLFMETTVVLFTFLTMWCHLRYFRNSNYKWLILCGLFMGATVAIKQFGYILPVVIFGQGIVLSVKLQRGGLWDRIKRFGVEFG